MPIYAYRCAECGHAKDVLQKMSDPVLTQCPACGAQAFTKQVTAAGFQLKGSGWYVTDFRGDNKAPAPAAEGGTTEGGKSEGGKSEGGKSEGGKSEAPATGAAPAAAGKADGAAAKPAAPAAAPAAAAPSSAAPAAGGSK